ncbi:hypothetical protein OIE66_33760 [Nonomuraea sp. NBC_01738]|uniref:hypothetical protein n=1 Tax=Nonomuraea sp. NBC_01738 TaxID=2976003 RepID=UPI002E1012F5|nr:hypothetical protein OIE66_33760 [Nonomuraea sp. NBC_01738]
MSRFVDELRDPWGWLLGATAGGAAWAVDVHPVGAVFVGVTVWLAKSGVAAMRPAAPPYRLGTVTSGSVESGWMWRAVKAAGRFARAGESIAAGPLADRIGGMRPQVEDAIATLQRLAEHTSVITSALGDLDPPFLRAELARLADQRLAADDDVAAELGRAVASLEAQLRVHERLAGARERLLARLESGTAGIEGLVARVVELSALAATGALERTGAVDELAGELEGIRLGLHETEEITRRAWEP